MSEPLNWRVESMGPVRLLTCHRPQALNALNQSVLQELDSLLSQFREEWQANPAGLRALVITGSGEKAFIAGADIKEMANLDPSGAEQFSRLGQRIFQKLEDLPFVSIAVVNGFALGGGLELALACDWILASENAKLGLPETGLGLIPGFGGTVRLAKVVGINKARELICTGEMLSAADAYRVGLIQHLASKEELLPLALKQAASVVSRGPRAVASAKRSIASSFDHSQGLALDKEASEFSELFGGAEMKEGTSAFLEKRRPNFSA